VYSGTLALKGATAGARVRGQMVEEGRRTVKERERSQPANAWQKQKATGEALRNSWRRKSLSLAALSFSPLSSF